jgi:hypothetical protein
MTIATGIREFDQEIRARGKSPAVATDIAAVADDATVVTISRKTRGLRLLAKRPLIKHVIAKAIDDPTLDLLSAAGSVETLSLNGSTMTSLRPLAALRKLRWLEISVASRLQSIEGLERLTRLEYFSVWHCVRLDNIAPLAGLKKLKLVFLAGAMYTPMRLASLGPLAGLTNLRVLKLANVRVRDRDLTPLHGLAALEALALPKFFSSDAFQALAAALPLAKGRWRQWAASL